METRSRRTGGIALPLILVCCAYLPSTFGVEPGTPIGPYVVDESLPAPTGNIGGLVFAEGFLYLVDGYNGIIHRLSPETGQVLATYWVPGDSLHDEWPYDDPRGLAWDQRFFYLATAVPDYLRTLTLRDPPDVDLEEIHSMPDSPAALTYAEGLLYYSVYLGPILRIQPETGAVVGSLPSPDDTIYGMIFDGDSLVAAYGPGGMDRTFWVISPQTGRIRDTWTVPGWTDLVQGLAYDDEADTLYIGSQFGIVVARRHASITYCVDDDAPPGGDGSSWATAFNDLQHALAVVTTGDVIRVAAGTYTPAPPGGQRSATFQLVNRVVIQGGYAGLEAADPDTRDVVAYRTVLSGDVLRNDGPDFAGNDENVYHVVTGSGMDPQTVLDGVHITAGNANGTWPHSNGGGLFIEGGGSPTLNGCTLFGNAGSGQYSWGGGAFVDEGRPTLNGCIFRGNWSGFTGGAMSCYDRGEPILNSCLLVGNEARVSGGALSYYNACTVLTANSSFAANTAPDGSAIACDSYQQQYPNNVQATNCIVWNGGLEVWNNDGSDVVINYSDVEGGWPGTGNIHEDPRFIDVAGADGIPGTADDDLRLSDDSPCIDAGDPARTLRWDERDLAHQPRVLCGRVDMGAFEFGIGDFECDRDVDLGDFAHWPGCMTGPGDFISLVYHAGCESFDVEFDGDVDLKDFRTFQRALPGQ